MEKQYAKPVIQWYNYHVCVCHFADVTTTCKRQTQRAIDSFYGAWVSIKCKENKMQLHAMQLIAKGVLP